MTDEINGEAVEEPFEMEDEREFSQKIDGLRQASRQRKYQIRRQIEEAEEKRRFKELFEDFDE